MFIVSAITLYCVFKAMLPFADTLVKECLWQLFCYTATIALCSSCTDLKLLQWLTVSLEFPKQHNLPDSDVGCLVVAMSCLAR